MRHLVLPNTFPMSTKASLKGDKTPGINFWEAPSLQQLPKKSPTWTKNRCCSWESHRPSHRNSDGEELQFKGSLAQKTRKQQPKKEENAFLCPSYQGKEVRMFTMTNPQFYIHSSDTGRSGSCSNLHQLQFRWLLHRRMREEQMKADLLPCSQPDMSIQH